MGFKSFLTIKRNRSNESEVSIAVTTTSTTIGNTSSSTASAAAARSKVKVKITSHSHPSLFPQTWQEYNKAYAAGLLDFNDPPPPPLPLALQEQYFVPSHPLESWRQRALDQVGISPLRPCFVPASFTTATPPTPSSSSLLPLPLPAPRRITSSPSLSITDSCRSLSSCASSSISGTSSSIATSYSVPIGTNYAEGLQQLAEKARTRFNTTVSIISVSDNALHAFIAESGFSAQSTTDRGSTPCSHGMLHGTIMSRTDEREVFVVPDLSKDWRFAQGNFGSSKFYASASVYASPSLGDTFQHKLPIATFCLLDPSPRTSFSWEDRQALLLLADEATVAVQKWQDQQRTLRLADLHQKRSTCQSRLRVLEGINEEPGSPGSYLNQVEDSWNSAAEERSVDASTMTDLSICGTIGREAASTPADYIVSSQCPIVRKCHVTSSSLSNRAGIASAVSTKIDRIQPLLDLTTKLLSETLDLTFTYLIAIEINPARDIPIVQLVSSYNLPIPTPLFDLAQHLSLLTSEQSILYVNLDTMVPWKNGIVRRVCASSSFVYLLAGFTDEIERVINADDLYFFKSFARDLQRLIIV